MEVILIRHTSVDVPPGVCYGQTDVPLKPTFEQEAAITQENLKKLSSFRPRIYQPTHTLRTSRQLLRLSGCGMGQTDYGD